MRLLVQLDYLVVQKNNQLLKPLMFGVKFVSRSKEALACEGSFAQLGGLIAKQNLAIHVSRTSCGPYNRNLWSYINDGPNCVT